MRSCFVRVNRRSLHAGPGQGLAAVAGTQASSDLAAYSTGRADVTRDGRRPRERLGLEFPLLLQQVIARIE